MNGLQKKGLCYEGVLNSIDDFLEIYRRQTVTTRGTRTSSNLQSDPGRTVCPESKKSGSNVNLVDTQINTSSHV